MITGGVEIPTNSLKKIPAFFASKERNDGQRLDLWIRIRNLNQGIGYKGRNTGDLQHLAQPLMRQSVLMPRKRSEDVLWYELISTVTQTTLHKQQFCRYYRTLVKAS